MTKKKKKKTKVYIKKIMYINNLFCEIFVLSVPTEAQNDKTEKKNSTLTDIWNYICNKMKIYMQNFQSIAVDYNSYKL